jgi:hypothetical protein
MSALIKMLYDLTMIGENKLKKSEASKSKEIFANIFILIKNPTNTERALWNLAQNKVREIAQKQPVSVVKEIMRIINLTTSNDILIGITKIARGLTKRKLSDITAAAYIQSSVDTGILFLKDAFK